MKRIFLGLGILAISTTSFSQQGFNDPRCPVFHRNNGNAGGCDSKLTLYFPSCPTNPYYIIGILNNGVPMTGITYTVGACNNGRIDICVQGANLPSSRDIGLLFSDAPNGPLLFACTRVPSGGLTPVTMSSFNARRNNLSVGLNWKTEFEDNIREFIIERKTANNFEEVGKVAAANILTGSTYSFTDNNGNRGASQYRIKGVDFDGAFTYSDIRNVKGTSGATDFFMFPNPSFGKVQLNVTDTEAPYDVEVIDNTGRIFKSMKVPAGTAIITLNDLPKGMHLVRLTNRATGETVTRKVSVL